MGYFLFLCVRTEVCDKGMGVGTFGKTWYGYFGRRLVFFVAAFVVRIIGAGFYITGFCV